MEKKYHFLKILIIKSILLQKVEIVSFVIQIISLEFAFILNQVSAQMACA